MISIWIWCQKAGCAEEFTMSQKPPVDEAILTFRRRFELSTLLAHRTLNESGHVVISSFNHEEGLARVLT